MPNETQFLDIVEKFYAAALDDNQWACALDGMADIFGAVGGSFEFIDKRTSKPIFLDVGTRLNTEGVCDEYIQYYGAISPRVQSCIALPTSSIMYDHAIISEAEMDRDEYYAEMNRTNGLRYFVSGHVLHTSSHMAVLAAQRSPGQGHVSDVEVQTMSRLLPHVQQAIDIKFRLAEARAESMSSFAAFEFLREGCIFIDHAGDVLHTNGQASKILLSGDGMALDQKKISFSDAAAASAYGKALRSLVREEGDDVDMAARDFRARRPSGENPYFIGIRQTPSSEEINPFASHSVAVIFIRDPSQHARLDEQVLRQIFGLTDAETELAGHLDRGLSLREIARSREVSITTIRSQLYTLMGKVAVNRQTDLVRLLMRYRKPLG